jgi:hypothetical protein
VIVKGQAKLTEIISNWPQDAQARFIDASENGSVFKIAIVGSPSMGVGDNGWSEQVKESLISKLNRDIDVQLFEFDGTSSTFLNSIEREEVVTMVPDLVLYEPFSLNDNTYLVSSEKNHANIEEFYEQLQEYNENVVLLLQPAHPIVGARVYPQQVRELQTFAKEKGFTYLDHWRAWPEEDALGEYLVDSQEEPNVMGHRVWAEFITRYFIKE